MLLPVALFSHPSLSPDSYYANKLRSFDRVNTVEQITIPAPENGIWKLSVKSNALPYGQQQRFSVTLSCIGVTQYSVTAANEVISVDSLGDSGEPYSLDSPSIDEDTSDEEGAPQERGWRSYLAPLWARFANLLHL